MWRYSVPSCIVANGTIFVSNSHIWYLPSLLSDYYTYTRFGIIGMFVELFTPAVVHDHSSRWYSCILEMEMTFSSSPACFIDTLRRSHHHSPMCFSVDTNAFFDKEGMPSTAIDSVCAACPHPVAICPHTGARLHFQ